MLLKVILKPIKYMSYDHMQKIRPIYQIQWDIDIWKVGENEILSYLDLLKMS